MKKVLSILLTVALLLGAAPVTMTAQAAEPALIDYTPSASGHDQSYVAGNVNDNDRTTFWVADQEVCWLLASLRQPMEVTSVVIEQKLSWSTRTQTMSIETSVDGEHFVPSVASADYTFCSS